MRFVFFTHSIRSDWNNGHVHFLRGLVRSLRHLGHAVIVHEPRDAWSVRQAMEDAGGAPLSVFAEDFPDIDPVLYDPQDPPLGQMVKGADVVVVQEWNDERLVRALGRHRRASASFRLYFHDAHHRLITAPDRQRRLGLEDYDAVLAFGHSLAARYEESGLARRVFVWHEAADTSTFRPMARERQADLAWIGNWGDDERGRQIEDFVVRPTRDGGFSTTVFGVRYPPSVLERFRASGIRHGGWVPNSRVPRRFAEHAVTMHVPRGPYADLLPGIPTIRVFEALACGIPLVSAPWEDRETLFDAGRDHLMAMDGDEAEAHVTRLLSDRAYAREVARQGLKTVHEKHTCLHRSRELLRIDRAIRDETDGPAPPTAPAGRHTGRSPRTQERPGPLPMTPASASPRGTERAPDIPSPRGGPTSSGGLATSSTGHRDRGRLTRPDQDADQTPIHGTTHPHNEET